MQAAVFASTKSRFTVPLAPSWLFVRSSFLSKACRHYGGPFCFLSLRVVYSVSDSFYIVAGRNSFRVSVWFRFDAQKLPVEKRQSSDQTILTGGPQ